jgi:hypothetical protein
MQGVVGTLRVPLLWFELEPQPGEYKFETFDRLLASAAERGIGILPFLYGSPSWLKRDHAYPPLGSRAMSAWSSFLRRLVGRYGPRGSFWQGRDRRLPIRRWQIWNEPNFVLFWRPWPAPGAYARLLRSSARAIRGEDPAARIVAAGVAPVETGMLPWAFLRRMYRTPDVRRSFDVAAVHPYGSAIGTVVYQLRRARRVMAMAGDGGKPLRITELGVASAGIYPNSFDRGRRGQARFLRGIYADLLENRRRWRIEGIDWFAWQDLPAHDNHCVFCQYAGLLDVRGRPKPAWHAFRDVISTERTAAVR